MYRLPRSAQADKPEKNARCRLVILMEVIPVIVVSIVVLLVVVEAPGYISAVKLARESVLKEDLQVLRDAIQSYTVDKMKRPLSLGDLLAAGYLKQIPEDPMTRSKDTWVTETAAALTGSGGIDDVHSRSQELGSNGRKYSTW